MDRVGRAVSHLAVQAAVVTAVLHLLWALPRLSWVPIGDSRPFIFVAAALLLITVAVAIFRGYHYRRLSTLGGGTLAALVVGYPLYHGSATADALAGEPLAMAALLTEAVGIGAFCGLYYLSHPARQGPTAADTGKRSGGDAE